MELYHHHSNCLLELRVLKTRKSQIWVQHMVWWHRYLSYQRQMLLISFQFLQQQLFILSFQCCSSLQGSQIVAICDQVQSVTYNLWLEELAIVGMQEYTLKPLHCNKLLKSLSNLFLLLSPPCLLLCWQLRPYQSQVIFQVRKRKGVLPKRESFRSYQLIVRSHQNPKR